MISPFETREVVVSLMAAYPAFTPKVELVEMVRTYHRVVSNLPASAVRRGAAEIMRQQKYFPSAQEIYAAAQRVMVQCQVAGIPLTGLDDAGQRMQDEMAGFAGPVLTYDGADWTRGQEIEFMRLTGKAPRKGGA